MGYSCFPCMSPVKEEKMKKRALALIFPILLVAVFGSTVQAAKWSYHPIHCNGWLTIWGTIDNQPMGPMVLERTYIYKCNEYSGRIPGWCNDILPRFEWDAPCGNVEWGLKLFAPQFFAADGKWRLDDLGDWIESHLPMGASMVFPCIGDSTGLFQTVYYGVNMEEWLADPRPLQDTYDIVDGECADLPGFLIGITPLEFDSLTGPGENPFSTTPLTGQLYLSAEFTVDPSTIPTLTQWGLVLLFVLIVVSALFVFRRRRMSA